MLLGIDVKMLIHQAGIGFLEVDSRRIVGSSKIFPKMIVEDLNLYFIYLFNLFYLYLFIYLFIYVFIYLFIYFLLIYLFILFIYYYVLINLYF